MRRTVIRAMTESRGPPVFVATTPARFGHSVWDAAGASGLRGLFYDEQAGIPMPPFRNEDSPAQVVVVKEVSGVLHLSKPESREDTTADLQIIAMILDN